MPKKQSWLNSKFLTRWAVAARTKALELFRHRLGKETVIEGWIEGPIAEAAGLRGINTLMLELKW